ncbi:MAG: glycosyltransferase family 4 protein [Pseudomonadota bacterium]|nr:glycosyltransferase family 4 protein [Pseudomonadota bacterium]
MINIGLTEMHGIAKECARNPPEGVRYQEIPSLGKPGLASIFTSPAQGVLDRFESDEVDIIEAPLFPVLTKAPWIYTPADFHSAVAFELIGLPTPRPLRSAFIRHLFLRNNFKRLVLKSQAGYQTIKDYPLLSDERILEKTEVVYPAIGFVADDKIIYPEHDVNIVFSGDFVRKGGMHVVDAFIDLQKKYPNIKLMLCTAPDLQTTNSDLRSEYLKKIHANSSITLGYVDRKEILDRVLPEASIFITPTYQETFGFAILEAMAYGIPVIATDYFAIPEMIKHGENGYLINIRDHQFIQNLKGYAVDAVPEGFKKYMNREVFIYLDLLINDQMKRRAIGNAALQTARSKFSFEKRNLKMLRIYKSALGR